MHIDHFLSDWQTVIKRVLQAETHRHRRSPGDHDHQTPPTNSIFINITAFNQHLHLKVSLGHFVKPHLTCCETKMIGSRHVKNYYYFHLSIRPKWSSVQKIDFNVINFRSVGARFKVYPSWCHLHVHKRQPHLAGTTSRWTAQLLLQWTRSFCRQKNRSDYEPVQWWT